MSRPISHLFRLATLAAAALASASCLQHRYYQDGYMQGQDENTFITNRPPRYGYKGTHSPNYNTEPGGTQYYGRRERDRGRESADSLHGSKKKPDSSSSASSSTSGSNTPTTPPEKKIDNTTAGNNTSSKPSSSSSTVPPAKKDDALVPFGTPVIGKKGFVYSPHAPEKGMVDVIDIASGTKVECPYTGKVFRVP